MSETGYEVLHRLESLCARVSMNPAWPMPLKLSVVIDDVTDGYRFRVTVRMPCTVTNLPQVTNHVEVVEHDHIQAMSDWEIVETATRLIRRAIMHELDECILVDGKAERHPHYTPRARCEQHRGACRVVSAAYGPHRFSCTSDETLREVVP